MVFFFVFFNFLFFRILSAAMFDDPLTIWASVLIAIVVTVIMAFAGPIGILASYENIDGAEKLSIGRLVLVALGACLASCLVSYLIVLGFSARLYDDISDWRRYRDFWEQDLFWFCIMISIPVIGHLGVMFRTLIVNDRVE